MGLVTRQQKSGHWRSIIGDWIPKQKVSLYSSSCRTHSTVSHKAHRFAPLESHISIQPLFLFLPYHALLQFPSSGLLHPCCYYHISVGILRDPKYTDISTRSFLHVRCCRSNKNIGGNHLHYRSYHRKEGRIFDRSQ